MEPTVTTEMASPATQIDFTADLKALIEATDTDIENDAQTEWYLDGLSKFELVEIAFKGVLAEVAKAKQEFTNRFEPSLQAYITKRLEIATGDGKTIKFGNGECSFRTIAGGLTISDAKAALAYAKAERATGVIKIIPAKEELDTKAYRELAKLEKEATGELIPGIEDRPDREEFYAKPLVKEIKQ